MHFGVCSVMPPSQGCYHLKPSRSFAEYLAELRLRYGDEAADVRHELFYLAEGRAPLVAGMRAFGALLRDAWLLMRHSGQELRPGEARQAILVTTLQGASGWGTQERSLPSLAAAAYEPVILAHPRLPAASFPAHLRVVRPARPGGATLLAALRVFGGALLRRWPLLLACCLARRYLWRVSLGRTLDGSAGVLLLHNDFDLMSRAALGHGLPAICLQHGVPTDEFFPVRADWYLIWGGRSRDAFRSMGAAADRLVEDALGRYADASPVLEPPHGLSLLSQTHAQILGRHIGPALRDFADALAGLDPQARILLHPLEREPYVGDTARAIRRPPHSELRAGACPPRVVMGYCSTAMLEAAAAGHWVVGLMLPLEGNEAARAMLSPPLRAETAEQAVALYHRLQRDAVFREESAQAQARWLRASFSAETGGLVRLLHKVGRSSPESTQ